MIVQLFDTETTGLIDNRSLPLKKQPSIIEWYSCVADLSTGEIISETEQLLKPPAPLEPIITKITGLVDADLADKPAFSVFAPTLREIVERGPRMIAHNASFDMEMVEIEFERLGQPITWAKRPICTVEATLPMKGFRLSLSALYEHLFGKTFPNAHRAKNDVMALLECACKLYELGEI